MARETQIRVRIPGPLNERLTEYIHLLEDIGVRTSKARLIITLAASGIDHNIEELRERAGHEDE